ncbi:hypothetical protein ACLOJK_016187 [Asimina triloba]
MLIAGYGHGGKVYDARLTTLYQGMQIDQCISKTLIPDIPFNNSVVTMYAWCGNITDASAIFDDMGMEKDVLSLNAMIGGYVQHGYAENIHFSAERMCPCRVIR